MRVLVVTGIWPPDVGGPATHAPEVGRRPARAWSRRRRARPRRALPPPRRRTPCTGCPGRSRSVCGMRASRSRWRASRASGRRRLRDEHGRTLGLRSPLAARRQGGGRPGVRTVPATRLVQRLVVGLPARRRGPPGGAASPLADGNAPPCGTPALSERVPARDRPHLGHRPGACAGRPERDAAAGGAVRPGSRLRRAHPCLRRAGSPQRSRSNVLVDAVARVERDVATRRRGRRRGASRRRATCRAACPLPRCAAAVEASSRCSPPPTRSSCPRSGRTSRTCSSRRSPSGRRSSRLRSAACRRSSRTGSTACSSRPATWTRSRRPSTASSPTTSSVGVYGGCGAVGGAILAGARARRARGRCSRRTLRSVKRRVLFVGRSGIASRSLPASRRSSRLSAASWTSVCSRRRRRTAPVGGRDVHARAALSRAGARRARVLAGAPVPDRTRAPGFRRTRSSPDRARRRSRTRCASARAHPCARGRRGARRLAHVHEALWIPGPAAAERHADGSQHSRCDARTRCARSRRSPPGSSASSASSLRRDFPGVHRPRAVHPRPGAAARAAGRALRRRARGLQEHRRPRGGVAARGAAGARTRSCGSSARDRARTSSASLGVRWDRELSPPRSRARSTTPGSWCCRRARKGWDVCSSRPSVVAAASSARARGLDPEPRRGRSLRRARRFERGARGGTRPRPVATGCRGAARRGRAGRRSPWLQTPDEYARRVRELVA